MNRLSLLLPNLRAPAFVLVCVFAWQTGLAEEVVSLNSPDDVFQQPAGIDFETGSLNGLSADRPLRRYKRQAVQSIGLSGGGVFATSAGDVSSRFLQADFTVGIPLGSFDNLLLATPAFRVDWLTSELDVAVPRELYEVGLQLFWRKTLSERWSIMTIVRPAVRSDFQTSDRALRVFGLGLLTWQAIPDELALSFGAVFLDRADIPLLPAIGLSWTPDPGTRIDLRFPESRIGRRIQQSPAESETWLYTSVGLGGNTWAVKRDSGSADEFSMRDLRVSVGLERIVDGGGGCFAEIGYAFRRRIEFENTGTEIDLDDGLLLSAGWNY